jgi:hypothetical protein
MPSIGHLMRNRHQELIMMIQIQRITKIKKKRLIQNERISLLLFCLLPLSFKSYCLTHHIVHLLNTNL